MGNNILEKKPDSKETKQLVQKFQDVDNKLSQTLISTESYTDAISKATRDLIKKEVEKTLEAIDIEEINRGELSVRVSSLKNAGFTNYLKVYNTQSFSKLYNIKGISELTAYAIKNKVYETAEEIRKNIVPRLNIDDKTKETDALVKALYIYQASQPFINNGKDLYNKYHALIQEYIKESKKISNKFVWLFTSKKKKTEAVNSYLELKELEEERFVESVTYVIDKITQISKSNKKIAWKDFETNSAKYYATLERLLGFKANDTNIRNGLPYELAQSIDKLPLNLIGLKCILRNYQEFGVKYILHQEKVLLGDEMGLGKTVQAIASMVNARNLGETHFLVVCPASVLINWCREISLHSDLKAMKLHGENREKVFGEWITSGGVAVTTYETMAKLDFSNISSISFLVADEAHYVKNPKANRTKNLMEVVKRAKRVLFMTGTALENNVDEMCYLLNCLQPEVAKLVDKMRHLSSAQMFREKIAPVYFRRTREDVLKELPDLIESEEWCEMNKKENSVYYNSTMSRNFMAMRQVSWNVDDIKFSSKAERLLEIYERAKEEKRKIIVFSYFLNTIEKVQKLLGDKCFGPINGSVSPAKRQEIIDEFSSAEDGSVLVAQIQAGGTGLNIQAASFVVLCEPQLKPSTENQAISRTYRIGQVRNVMVFRLLCENSIDERIMDILGTKQVVFDNFADKSIMGEHSIQITDQVCNKIIDSEIERLQAESLQQK